MKYLSLLCFIGVAFPSVASAQETANAIIACRVQRVDASYRNPQSPSELRVLEPRLNIVIGLTVVGSNVITDSIRLSDPGLALGGNPINKVSWDPQTRGFVIRTDDVGEGAVMLIIAPPEAGKTTFGATVVRTNEAAIRNPLAYMFDGRCGVVPTMNLSVDFDRYVAAFGSRP